MPCLLRRYRQKAASQGLVFCQKNVYIFLTKNIMAKHTNSIDANILSRIRRGGVGRVFTPSDFLDLGSRAAVDQALSRSCRAGAIRQVTRGLYYIPRRDPQLGPLSPSVDAIADALKSQHAIRLQPSGGYAANLLGLSDQVPMKVVFLTDGLNRQIQIGKQQIILKRTTPRNMATADRVSGLVIQALRHLGQRNVDDRLPGYGEGDVLRRGTGFRRNPSRC